MRDAPQGTVTFLFTDIVGSTRLWEKFPALMGRIIARHDTLVRTAVERHQGHVFKTVGDAFCVAFKTPREALEAAVETQRGLSAQDWGEIKAVPVRMGIHTGTAEFREGDYFGGALNRCSRIEAAAHGGQILLSQASHELLVDEKLDGLAFKPLGTHRLRNLDRPEHLFQVSGGGFRDDFPPPRSLEVLPNNLPAQSTTFVGREREIEEVKRQLTRARLLTLIGTGGTGKTRLALESGAQLIHDFTEGVWLVELALVTEPDHVVEAVASAIGARAEADRPLKELLLRFLQNKQLLLILDNCEHLMAAVTSLVVDMLRACPQLRILATSRHSLGIVGEVILPVPPLAIFDVRVESLSGPDLAERLSQYEAVKLFIERATAVRPISSSRTPMRRHSRKSAAASMEFRSQSNWRRRAHASSTWSRSPADSMTDSGCFAAAHGPGVCPISKLSRRSLTGPTICCRPGENPLPAIGSLYRGKNTGGARGRLLR